MTDSYTKDHESATWSDRQEKTTEFVILCVVLFCIIMAILTTNGTVSSQKLFGICGFEQKHNLPCPFCGMTSAASELVKGDVFHAFYVQPAAALFYLLGIVAAIVSASRLLGIRPKWLYCRIYELKLRYIIVFVLLVIAGGWAVTLSRAMVK